MFFAVTYLSKSRFRSSLLEVIGQKAKHTSMSSGTDISKLDPQLKREAVK